MPTLKAEMALLPLASLWVVAAQGVSMPLAVAVLTAVVLGLLVIRRLSRGVQVGAPLFWLGALAAWVTAEALGQPVPWDHAAHLVACAWAAVGLALVSAHPSGQRWLRHAAVVAGGLSALWLLLERLGLGGRPGGPFLNPNLAAAPVALALALVLSQRRRAWHGPVVVLLLVGVWASASRAGALAVLAVALVLAWGRLKPRQLLGAGALALVAASFLAWRLATDRDPLRFERLRIWRAAWQVGWAYAPWGTGPGGLSSAVLAFNFPREGEFARFARIPDLAENDLLQAFASLGMPGLALAAGLAASLLGRGWRRGPRVLAPLVVVACFSAFHTQLPWPAGALLAVAAGSFSGRSRLRLSFPLALMLVTPMGVWVAGGLPWPAGWPGDRLGALQRSIQQALQAPDRAEQLASALVRAEELVRLAPRSGESYRTLALVQYHLARALRDGSLMEHAVGSFRHAHQLNSNDVWAFYGEGLAWLALGEAARGRAAFTRALQLEPNCVRCWLSLAQAQLFSGDTAAASQSWEKAHRVRRNARGQVFVSRYEAELAAWDPMLAERLRESLGVKP